MMPRLPRLTIRNVTDDDRILLWTWANEASVRAASFHPEPIPWDDHVVWFALKRSDPRCRMYLTERPPSEPIAQVRFDQTDGGWFEVDVSMRLDCRGMGLAAEVLSLACRRLGEDVASPRVVAHVKSGNVASLRAFVSAGFRLAGGKELRDGSVVRLEWEASR